MPSSNEIPLNIPAGVVKTRSGEGAVGRWVDGDNFRFVNGKPRKRAGFRQHGTTVVSGKARGMDAWNTVRGAALFAIGTNLKLYGSTDGVDSSNITPYRDREGFSGALSTTSGLGAVTAAKTAHGWSAGQLLFPYGNSFQGGSFVAGIPLNREMIVVDVPDADSVTLYANDDTGSLTTDPLATVNTSADVTVTHAAHGRSTGDAVWFSGATAVNGITIAGDYAITVIDVNSYTITHSSPATGDGAGGGASVDFKFSEAANATVSDSGGVVPYLTYVADPFDTTDTEADVTVTHVGHGARTGDTVVFSGASAVGGITIDGSYTLTVVDADTFTITHSEAATSTANGGGSDVLIAYEISTGPETKLISLRGFGEGPLGAGFFGGTESASDLTFYDPRTWSIDANGEDAICCPLGGSIYYWDSSAAGRADRIPNSPEQVRYAFQTEERHLHALGLGTDPLVFAWASQGDYDVWTPTETNTANSSRRVREGSALIAGTSVSAGVSLIWTDTAVYIHQYTGSRFIYDTRLDAKNSGLIAPQAFVVTSTGVFWMSANRFKMWNGATRDVPNAMDIEDWVYENLDPENISKCNASFDPINNSIDFYYVPLGGVEPTEYVTLCLDDFSWSIGSQSRTTGAVFNSGRKEPYRVGVDGKLYQHEYGFDADGVAAVSSVTLAPFEIGQSSMDVVGFDPDFKDHIGEVELELSTYDRNPRNIIETASETIRESDEIVDLRVEGRHVSLTLSQEVLGGDWSIDTPKIEIRRRGRRR